jgi:hypothetical protein
VLALRMDVSLRREHTVDSGVHQTSADMCDFFSRSWCSLDASSLSLFLSLSMLSLPLEGVLLGDQQQLDRDVVGALLERQQLQGPLQGDGTLPQRLQEMLLPRLTGQDLLVIG